MSSKSQSQKTIHSLKSPYPEPLWPNIAPQLENEILDLILPPLEAAGQFRGDHDATSKKSRRKKRRRIITRSRAEGSDEIDSENVSSQPAPNLGTTQHLTVGYNSTVGHLESLAQRDQHAQEMQVIHASRLVAIFVCKVDLPAIMTAPLPLLAAVASRYDGGGCPIILVPISQMASMRIAGALRYPKVNILGILAAAPGMEGLEDILRNKVGPVDVSWINRPASFDYQHSKVRSKEIVVSKTLSKKTQRKRKVNDAP